MHRILDLRRPSMIINIRFPGTSYDPHLFDIVYLVRNIMAPPIMPHLKTTDPRRQTGDVHLLNITLILRLTTFDKYKFILTLLRSAILGGVNRLMG